MSELPSWADVRSRYVPKHDDHSFSEHIRDLEELKAQVKGSNAPMLALQAAGVELHGRTFKEQQEYAHTIYQKLRHLKEVSIDTLADIAAGNGIGTVYGEFITVEEGDAPLKQASMLFGVETDVLLSYAKVNGRYSLPNAAFMEVRDALEQRNLRVMSYKDTAERFSVRYLPADERPRRSTTPQQERAQNL